MDFCINEISSHLSHLKAPSNKDRLPQPHSHQVSLCENFSSLWNKVELSSPKNW
jgi:hypothetical protein